MLRYVLSSLFLVAGLAVMPEQAQAAPQPVEYVRICDAYGSGFYYIPGTDTCLKIGGYVRTDITYGSYNGRTTFARTGGGNTDSSQFTQSDTTVDFSVGARAYVPLGNVRAFVGADTAPAAEQEIQYRIEFGVGDGVHMRVVYHPNRFTTYGGVEMDLGTVGNGTLSGAVYGGARFVKGEFFLSGQAVNNFSTSRSVTRAVPVIGTEISWQWKLAENSSPIPRDRITFRYNYFLRAGIQFQGGVDETLSASTPFANITGNFEVDPAWTGYFAAGINF